MKKLSFLLLLLAPVAVLAQYCMPFCQIYSSTMPGITNVQLGAINRTSADCEAGCPVGGSNFVTTAVTQQTTNLVRGQTYSLSMSYTVDAPICPDMNLRVYIDYNQNFQLDDAGETVVTANNKLPGTYTASITIPTTASLGATRLRAAVKMTSNGGHTLPTPCNSPPDPIGFHGEMEDYTVNIVNATGIGEYSGVLEAFSVFPRPGAGYEVLFILDHQARVSLGLFDAAGRLSAPATDGLFQAGQHEWLLPGDVVPGIYFVRLIVDGKPLVRKVAITG